MPLSLRTTLLLLFYSHNCRLTHNLPTKCQSISTQGASLRTLYYGSPACSFLERFFPLLHPCFPSHFPHLSSFLKSFGLLLQLTVRVPFRIILYGISLADVTQALPDNCISENKSFNGSCMLGAFFCQVLVLYIIMVEVQRKRIFYTSGSFSRVFTSLTSLYHAGEIHAPQNNDLRN